VVGILVIGGSEFGMWWMMGEAGGHYCSKKTDDICGGVCSQVCSSDLPFCVLLFCVLEDNEETTFMCKNEILLHLLLN
jgi:hypothetical protein